MSYPYKTEHKEISLHCNFLTIKHYYRKVKGACIIISFLKSLTSRKRLRVYTIVAFSFIRTFAP